MSSKERQDEYLAKAEEAQAQAEKAIDSVTKDSWLRIAESYREMARRQMPEIWSGN